VLRANLEATRLKYHREGGALLPAA